MNYSAIDLMPNWLTASGLKFPNDSFQLKKDSINRLLENIEQEESEDAVDYDFDFWLDVVRLAFGMTIKPQNRVAFTNAFSITDNNFPLTDNANLLSVLSRITLCAKIEEAEYSLEETAIALAIICRHHAEEEDLKTPIPMLEYANSYCSGDSKSDRNTDVNLEERLDKVIAGANDNSQSKELAEIIKTLVSNQRALLEETNILWWLHGEYFVKYKQSFKEVGLPLIIPIAATELADLTEFSSPVPISIGILRKVIELSSTNGGNAKPITLESCIESTNDKSFSLFSGQRESCIDLTPYLFAFQNSGKIGVANVDGVFKKEYRGATTKKEILPEVIADRIYFEILFHAILERIYG